MKSNRSPTVPGSCPTPRGRVWWRRGEDQVEFHWRFVSPPPGAGCWATGLFFQNPQNWRISLKNISQNSQKKSDNDGENQIEKNRKNALVRGREHSRRCLPEKDPKTGLDQCTTVIRACRSVVGSGHKYKYNQQIVGFSDRRQNMSYLRRRCRGFAWRAGNRGTRVG